MTRATNAASSHSDGSGPPSDDNSERDSEGVEPNSQEPILSLPNLLTLVRLPMAAAVWWLGGDRWWLIGLMIAAAATDMLDGWFARRIRRYRETAGLATRNLGGPQGRGAWLDPLCDKIFVVSVIGATWFFHAPAWWLVALVALREVLLVPTIVVHRHVLGMPGREHFDVRATSLGKFTTVMQFFAIWAILLNWPAQFGLALLAAVLGVFSVLDYVSRALKAAAQSRSA